MGVAAACATIELALAIDSIVSRTHTIQTALLWGRTSVKYLSVVIVMFYIAHIAARFEHRGFARLAALMGCGQLVVGVVCFVVDSLGSGGRLATWLAPGTSYLAQLYWCGVIRMAAQLVVWIPTLIVTWKFGSMLRQAASGRCLCCGYPMRDLLSGRCPECGAKFA